MRTCTNCGAQITCGCQVRVASNGTSVCSNCIALYEQEIKNAQTTNTNPNEKPLT
jgi:ribosome-binding protein aMBF1 (putative translation factor)